MAWASLDSMSKLKPSVAARPPAMIGISRIREILCLEPTTNYRTVRDALDRLGIPWVSVTQRGQMATACRESVLLDRIEQHVGTGQSAGRGRRR